MNIKEFTKLHLEVDNMTIFGKDKEGYDLVRYAEVKVLLDKIYSSSNKDNTVK